MKRCDETVKLIAETIRNSLTKFVGERVDENTVTAVRDQMISVLTSFRNVLDVTAPLPEIKVTVDGNQATVSFFDPKTKEQIDLATWTSRSVEGFYD